MTFGRILAEVSTRQEDPVTIYGNDEEIVLRPPPGVTGTVEVAVTTPSGMFGPFSPFSQLTCQ
jgi:hypothetical protein